MRLVFTMHTVTLFLAMLLVTPIQSASAQRVGEVLIRGTAEFGWSHRGVRSWGSRWEVRAKNEALARIQRQIAAMVNLAQLDTFTKKNNSRAIKGEGAGTYGYGEGKLAYADSMNKTSQTRWINRNNFLVVVRDIRIKPGTAFSKTRTEGFPTFRRSWDASATMLYKYEILGRRQSKRQTVRIEIRLGRGFDDYKSYYIDGKFFKCRKGRKRRHSRTYKVQQEKQAAIQLRFDAQLGTGKRFVSRQLKSGRYEFRRSGRIAYLVQVK